MDQPYKAKEPEETENGHKIFVHPGSSAGFVKIQIALNSTEAIKVVAFNNSLTAVEIIADGTFEKGIHELEWEVIKQIPGLYRISVTIGKTVSGKKIMIK